MTKSSQQNVTVAGRGYQRQMLWQENPLNGLFYPHGLRRKKAQVLELVGQWDDEEAVLRENLRCAVGLGDKPLLAKSQFELGGVLYLKGDNAGALALYQQALDIFQTLADNSGTGLVMGGMGCLYRELGDLSRAMDCFLEQLRIARQGRDSKGISRSFGNMGIVHCLQENYGEAMGCFRQKLELAEGLDDQESIGATVGNMGNVYKMLGDQAKALECYDRQLAIARRLGDKRSIGAAVGNSGVIHNDRGDFGRAISCLSSFLEIASELGDKRGMGIASANLGIACKRSGDYENSEKHYNRAIDIGRQLNARQYLCGYLSDLADLFLMRGRLPEAEKLIREGLQTAEEIGEPSDIFKCRLLSARIGAGGDRGALVRALEHLLIQSGDEGQKAELHYELFCLTSGADHRTAALSLYRKLAERDPDPEYRRRLEVLEKG